MRNEYEISRGVFVPLERKAILMRGAFARVLWALFGALWVGVIIIFAKNVENPVAEIVLCSVIVAYSLYKVLLDASVRAWFRFFVLSRQIGKSSWVRTIAFESEYIAIKDESREQAYKYADIKEIGQNEAYIALVLHSKQVIWLRADGFVGTALEEVVALISVKREYEN